MKAREVGSVKILAPKGYFTGGDETDVLQRTIYDLAAQGHAQLVVNLAAVIHFNSQALDVLIRCRDNYRQRGGNIKLCAVDKRIENITVITKLSLVFDVYPTEEQAIASFSAENGVNA